jgi:hypothetical protein
MCCSVFPRGREDKRGGQRGGGGEWSSSLTPPFRESPTLPHPSPYPPLHPHSPLSAGVWPSPLPPFHTHTSRDMNTILPAIHQQMNTILPAIPSAKALFPAIYKQIDMETILPAIYQQIDRIQYFLPYTSRKTLIQYFLPYTSR